MFRGDETCSLPRSVSKSGYIRQREASASAAWCWLPPARSGGVGAQGGGGFAAGHRAAGLRAANPQAGGSEGSLAQHTVPLSGLGSGGINPFKRE